MEHVGKFYEYLAQSVTTVLVWKIVQKLINTINSLLNSTIVCLGEVLNPCPF